ncbi:S1 family peptidase [Dactylosporangium sp. NPDC005572]|uniref:S1 family peptidase n=1 Tax=Dactylosporangium sp. NPDC005572 TaxID=3156889 RepID=UPI0033AD3E49
MRAARAFAAVIALVAVALPATAAEAAPGVGAFERIAGTAWWHDPAGGRLTVSLDDTVRPATAAALSRAVTRAGGVVLREAGVLRKHIAGADPFFGAAGGRCLIGFNARALPDSYFLTSAHCVGAVGGTVYADAAHTVVLGTVATKNAMYDYALVRYTNGTIAKPSAVNLHNGTLAPITSFGNGYVGQTVTRSGATGVRTGRITALNATVNYADGTVYGLIRASVCTEPGDSGGPLFAGSVGLGMTSGGSGNCTSGGTTYFASASRAANAYGVTPY